MRWIGLILALMLLAIPVRAQEAARLEIGASSLTQTGRGWWGKPRHWNCALG